MAPQQEENCSSHGPGHPAGSDMRGIVSEYQISFDNLAAPGNQSERPQPVSVSEVDMVPMKEFENLK